MLAFWTCTFERAIKGFSVTLQITGWKINNLTITKMKFCLKDKLKKAAYADLH